MIRLASIGNLRRYRVEKHCCSMPPLFFWADMIPKDRSNSFSLTVRRGGVLTHIQCTVWLGLCCDGRARPAERRPSAQNHVRIDPPKNAPLFMRGPKPSLVLAERSSRAIIRTCTLPRCRVFHFRTYSCNFPCPRNLSSLNWLL